MVSRSRDIFPLGKLCCERFGSADVSGTTLDGDALNFVINDRRPGLIIMESSFYKTATPFMVGRLIKDMPFLHIAIFNLGEYPASLEPEFIRFGAESYITLRNGIEEFYQGLEKILRGSPYIASTVYRQIELAGDDTVTGPDKSVREHEVMVLLAGGATTQEIKETLKISFRTVEHHKTNLFARLRVKNTVQMIRMALHLGELDIQEFMEVMHGDKKPNGGVPDTGRQGAS
jgi:two-component system invasion response regulator UvrY